MIESLWKGDTNRGDKHLSNAMLGINRYNERFITTTHKCVLDEFAEMRERYNDLLKRVQDSNNTIHHLLHSTAHGDEVRYEHGLFWRYFDGDYSDRNLLIYAKDLDGIVCVDKTTASVTVDPANDVTTRIKKLLARVDPQFPKSLLNHIGRHKTRNRQNDIIIEFYCTNTTCAVSGELCIPKYPLLQGYECLFLNIKFDCDEDGEALQCVHPNGMQKQTTRAFTEQTLKQFAKIGDVYSPQLMLQRFVQDGDINDIEAGVDATGLYNINNIKNLERTIKSNEYGNMNDQIQMIEKAQEDSLQADLAFNESKLDQRNSHFYGEIHWLNWLYPVFVMLYNYCAIILFGHFVIDLFVDFTEGLIADWRHERVYNLMAVIGTPLGGIFPLPLFEVITQAPNGETVAMAVGKFLTTYYLYSQRKRVTHTVYVHTDRFKGFLYGLYKGSNYEGHPYNYLLDGIKYLQTMNPIHLSKYWFRLYFCEDHTMSALGSHTKNVPSTWTKPQKYCMLATSMELHRYINYSLNVVSLLGYLNLLKFILTTDVFKLGRDLEFEYITLESIQTNIQKAMKDPMDIIENAEIRNTAQRSKTMNEIQSDIYDWKQSKNVNNNCVEIDNTTKFDAFMNDYEMEFQSDGDLVYFRPLAKYPWIYGVANTETHSLNFFPPNISPITSANLRPLVVNNMICLHKEWKYYLVEHAKWLAVTSHIIVGGSVHKNNAIGELANRFKKQQTKSRTALSLAYYIATTVANRLLLRQSWFIQFRDQVARLSFKLFSDSVEFDGITKKNKVAKLSVDDELHPIAVDLQQFYTHYACMSYIGCYRMIASKCAENDYCYGEMRYWEDKDNKTNVKIISRLLKMEQPSKKQKQVIQTLGLWLIEWKKANGYAPKRPQRNRNKN